MKRILLMIMLSALALAGCGASETFETISDVYVVSASAEPRTILLELPEEAASPAMESGDTAQVYLCDGYAVMLEILPAGDLDRTLRTLTGFSADELMLIQTGDGVQRYDCVWSSQAEEGDMIGRAAVLDDGQYHYTLSVLAEAELAGELESTWNMLFAGFALSDA